MDPRRAEPDAWTGTEDVKRIDSRAVKMAPEWSLAGIPAAVVRWSRAISRAVCDPSASWTQSERADICWARQKAISVLYHPIEQEYLFGDADSHRKLNFLMLPAGQLGEYVIPGGSYSFPECVCRDQTRPIPDTKSDEAPIAKRN